MNATALGLMAAVCAVLARDAVVDWYTAALAALAVAVLPRFNVNSAWLVAGGGVAGLIHSMLGG